MTATFLVSLDIDDPSLILEDAQEISDVLESAGLSVTSVKPWARPSNPILLPTPQ